MIVCLLVGFVLFGLFGGLVIGVFFSVVFNYMYFAVAYYIKAIYPTIPNTMSCTYIASPGEFINTVSFTPPSTPARDPQAHPSTRHENAPKS